MKNNQSFLPFNSNKLLNPVVENLIFSKKLKKLNFLTNRNFSSSSNSNSGSNSKLDSKAYKTLSKFVKVFPSSIYIYLLVIASYFPIFKTILFYNILIGVLYLIYSILNLYILLLYLRKKMSTPLYLPDYIRNWFLKKEEISKCKVEEIRILVDLEIRHIITIIVLTFILIIEYKILVCLV